MDVGREKIFGWRGRGVERWTESSRMDRLLTSVQTNKCRYYYLLILMITITKYHPNTGQSTITRHPSLDPPRRTKNPPSVSCFTKFPRKLVWGKFGFREGGAASEDYIRVYLVF